MTFLSYENDKDLIIKLILENKRDMKICIKARDEIELMPDILNHLKNAGFFEQDIIIFDHQSNNKDYIKWLEDISKNILVVRFNGDHNDVHTTKFIDIYKALAKSTKYFLFLDSDEFLYLIDFNSGRIIKENIKDKIIEFLNNVQGEYDTFIIPYPCHPVDLFGNLPKNFFNSIFWAKIIFKSSNLMSNSTFFSGYQRTSCTMHMIQSYFCGCKIYPKLIPLLLIHDKFRYPERTVRMNIIKLLRIKEFKQILLDDYGINTEPNPLEQYHDIVKLFCERKEEIVSKLKNLEQRSYVRRNISAIQNAYITKDEKEHLEEIFDKFFSNNKSFWEEMSRTQIFYGLPHMSYQELLVFLHNLNSINSYIEYGSGLSTLIAMQLGVKNIVSIENHPEWYKQVKANISELKKVSVFFDTKVFYEFINTGKVGDWGMPIDDRGWRDYYKYVLAPWEISLKNNIQPDLVLIDGRFRVASFIVSLFFSPKGTRILFHDYSNRHHYHIIEEFIKPKEIVESLAIFIKENDVKFDFRLFKTLLSTINYPEYIPAEPSINSEKMILLPSGNIMITGTISNLKKQVKNIISSEGNFLIKSRSSDNKTFFFTGIVKKETKDIIAVEINYMDGTKDVIGLNLVKERGGEKLMCEEISIWR